MLLGSSFAASRCSFSLVNRGKTGGAVLVGMEAHEVGQWHRQKSSSISCYCQYAVDEFVASHYLPA